MKKLPEFKSEEEEAEFWDTHDTTEYTEEWDELIIGGPKSASVHIRVEPQVKAKLEEYAHSKNMEISDMVRPWFYEGLEREIRLRFPEPGSAPKTLEAAERRYIEILGTILHQQGEMIETLDRMTKVGKASAQQAEKRGRISREQQEVAARTATKKASPGKKKARKSPAKRAVNA